MNTMEYLSGKLKDQIQRLKSDKNGALECVSEFSVKAIKEQIKRMRKSLRMRQSDLAQISGLKQPAISRLENESNHSVTLSTLQTVANSMGCVVIVDIKPLSEVLSDIEKKP